MSGHFRAVVGPPEPPPELGASFKPPRRRYNIVFENHGDAQGAIEMQIPESGIFEDHPEKELTLEKARDLAQKVAKVFQDELV